MEKKIEDYLHLYIGRECKYQEHNEKSDWCIGKITPAIITPNRIHSVKPILRPLSDMTEEEKNEYLLTGTDSSTRFEHNARRTQYLLSKGFDLFGLIDAGLAINKNTIAEKKSNES